MPPLFWLLVGTTVLLLPFINKAFHIDDSLFLWTAEHLQKHPGNFYGFTVNWYGTEMPAGEAFNNPPLTSCYIALIASVVGWSEPALHLAFLLPALLLVAGTYILARNYCSRPALATLAGIATPVFLISATTVMCDIMLVAFWVWSLVFFERGLQSNRWHHFILSGLLAGLGVLTKFSALGLVPLMLAYGVVKLRKPGTWIISPVLPLVFAGAYQLITEKMYGRGFFSVAADYTSMFQSSFGSSPASKIILGLCFIGGCFFSLLFYLPLLRPSRTLLLAVCIIAPLCLILPLIKTFQPLCWTPQDHLNWSYLLQSSLLITLGALIVIMGVTTWFKKPDPISLMLLFWILGILAFASIVNWTVNGRSVLPMLPAVGILLGRWLDQTRGIFQPTLFWREAWPVIPGAALSIVIAQADTNLANTGREAARMLSAIPVNSGNTMWFQGHWGFQYYMQQRGAKALDLKSGKVTSGDLVVMPSNYSHVHDFAPDMAVYKDLVQLPPHPWCATMNRQINAGFYATSWGLLPFVFASPPEEKFFVFEVRKSVDLSTSTSCYSPRGILYGQFQLEDETQRLQSSLKNNPVDAESHYRLGKALLSRRNRTEASNHLLEALKLNPNHGLAHYDLAGLLETEGKFEDAIREYRAAIDAIPESAEARCNLAWILATHPDAKIRNGQEALRLATKACDFAVEVTPVFLRTLAAAQAECEQFEKAIGSAQKALALARASKDEQIGTIISGQLQFYQQHKPYHQPLAVSHSTSR